MDWLQERSVGLRSKHGGFMVLNELQLRYQKNLSKQVKAYAALAEERYDLPVYSVLINILSSPATTGVASCYELEFMGLNVC